ncbi:hypothetical protein SAMN05216419_100158 [Nitrosomonas cryotolerans]|uniref:Transposase DDE domain-containing protein n=1 Tax=Nitrosomonas cryotolerans ATCC 49181 TaxID=1131553 RepID=A0A1N6IR52_9PROT|nr:hypothetical protein SAMN05216419_100158 [Nitrosomonas cryotolerans]SIO34510.1 hypothetical protein SAMN02743940_2007 [Nitrosomonas cryotolerans ATCC 49181]
MLTALTDILEKDENHSTNQAFPEAMFRPLMQKREGQKEVFDRLHRAFVCKVHILADKGYSSNDIRNDLKNVVSSQLFHHV